jgi:hypothetical protein
LPDNTEITLFNFTKGNDNWKPLEEEDETGIENTAVEAKKAIKMIREGNVYILRDDALFTITGARVQ